MKKQKDYRKILKEYLKLIKNYKGIIAILVVCLIIIEILRLIPKFLFAQLIDSGVLFTAGDITRELFLSKTYLLLFIFIISSLLTIFLIWSRTYLSIKLDSNLIIDLKNKYFNHIIGLDTEFHTTHKTGSLISRLNRGSGAVEGLTDTVLFNFTPVIVQLVILGFSIAYFSIAPAIALLITSIVFLIYSIKIQNLQKKDKIILNDTEDFEKGNMSDFFTNIESIKYFGKENYIKTKYKKLTEETKSKAIKYWNWYKIFDSGQSIILALGTILIISLPIIDFLNGKITIGIVSFIYTSYLSLVIALYGFVWGIRSLYRNMTDLESLFKYNEFQNNIKDKKNARKLKIINGEIEFKNIDFTYPNGQKIFENLSLKIPKGKKVALIGQSGCGKSTLIKLLYRLYDVESGEIIIDGRNIKDVKQESLRNEMAVVSQEPILFDDTIYNNIKFSNQKATKDEVMRAIRFAQLNKVIEKLPKKEKTIVGERGIKRSGGQKQRVSIARAILANKKILVFDEATSSLDSKTENEIQNDFEKLMRNRTSIIIAHRLSTIMKSDIIVVMKNGKIEQIGTHRELITEGGEYELLWNYQKGGYLQDNLEDKEKE